MTYLYGMGYIGQETGGEMTIALADRLGSVRQLITDGQNQALLQSFDPFGNPMASLGEGKSGFGYTGEQTDGSGLVYLRARYYDPGTGRFISADPFPGVLSLAATQNAYIYGVNDPLNHTDHSGLFFDALLDIVFLKADIDDINTKIGGGCKVSTSDWAALVFDVISLMIPFLPAIGGVILRGASHLDDIYDAGRYIDDSIDFFKNAKQFPLPGILDNSKLKTTQILKRLPIRSHSRSKATGLLLANGQEYLLRSGWEGPTKLISPKTSGFDIVTRTHVEGHAAALMRLNN
jgi:RHS repeat-associated protein